MCTVTGSPLDWLVSVHLRVRQALLRLRNRGSTSVSDCPITHWVLLSSLI